MRAGELRVASEQRRIERFGERHVSAVICSQRLAQLPYPREQLSMRMALDDQACEIFEGLLRAPRIDVLQPNQTAQSLNNFDVEQMRSVQPLVRRKCPRAYPVRAGGPEKKLEQRRRIDDNQRPSRSARTASAGTVLPL